MIKVVSKSFNGEAHDSTNIPDISLPIILHKVKPGKIDYEFQRDLAEYRLELEFYDPDIIIETPVNTSHCQFTLGKFLNYELYLEVDGKEYRYSDIYTHEMEMTAIISDAVANQLIEEITDD